jgi:RNA polymerase sigma factor (sigma-70 family)
MLTDADLLKEYVARGSDDAFRLLVERHLAMVHAAAWRAVGNAHLAAEVTQAVFIILARKAARLPEATVLAGWLYRTTGFVAREALRSERRRQKRRDDLANMKEEPKPDEARWWEQVAPLLEAAMARLGATDRNALVLRYFEECSFAEVASALGTTEASAKMRVSRAVQKLRDALGREGLAIPAATLPAVLAAHGTAAPPAGLSALVATAALAPSHPINPALTLLVKATLQAMTLNKYKPVFLLAALLLVLTGSAVVLRPRPSPPPPAGVAAVAGPGLLQSFDPLAGDWEGTFGMRGDGIPEEEPRGVRLRIATTERGHLCEIEMKVLDPSGRAAATYQFSHRLNPAGDRIRTDDDPQIGWMSDEGPITESVQDAKTGEWRVSFRTPRADGTGHSECRWVRKADELNITREDHMVRPQGTRLLASDLKLFRRAPAKAQP